MQITNPNNLPLIPIKDVIVTQGALKDLSVANYAKLKASIDKHGFIYPIAVWHNEGNYYLLDGTQRKRVLDKEYPDAKVPALTIPAESLQDAAEILLKITSQYGTITQEGIDAFIATYELPEYETYEAVSFDALPYLGSSEDEEVVEDSVPEVTTEAISKLGEVYMLGKHRVMCGDSTNGEQVNELLNGHMPNLMVTDPPYGVDYDANWRNGHDLNLGELGNGNARAIGKVSNDNQVDWTAAYELFGGNVAYVWHSAVHTSEIAQNLQDLGFDLITQIIWVKQHFVLSRGDYHWQHEPCWYVVRKGEKHSYVGDRKQTSVWDIRNNNPMGGEREEKTGHSTQKPVEAMARPIRNNSNKGDTVYDPFLGSGTTIIAAEQLGRICYGMELEPKYVDVIRKRYAQYIGEEDWQAVTPQIS